MSRITKYPRERSATSRSWLRRKLSVIGSCLHRHRRCIGWTLMALVMLAGVSGDAMAAAPELGQMPSPFGEAPTSGAQSALRILALMTVLSLLPSLVLTMTCFTRIIIVFSFLRQALGIQGMPPNQILVGMALFLSMFIMAPVVDRIHEDAVAPLMNDTIGVQEAVMRAKEPLANFMLAHTRDEDLQLFLELSREPRPELRKDVPFRALVPAFSLSEVRTAFQMGFLVLMPFMVIDLVVSSVLMAMGMMMLPPALIALPLKIMIFVLADGWSLLIRSLAQSFQT